VIYVVELATYGKIYLPSFMKVSRGVQAILRFRFSNFKDFNIGITDERDL
jgi:hypothetical protein